MSRNFAPCFVPREAFGQTIFDETNEHKEHICKACGYLQYVHNWGITGRQCLVNILGESKVKFGAVFCGYSVSEQIALSAHENQVVFRGSKRDEDDVIIKACLPEAKFAIEQMRNEEQMIQRLAIIPPCWAIHLCTAGLSLSHLSFIYDYIGSPIPRVIATSIGSNVAFTITRPAGRLLRDFLAFHRGEFPPSSDARRLLLNKWLTELIEAVLFMHCRGVIHRDIKPSNMILVNNHVQLIDLGLAWGIDQKVPEPAGTFDFASANVLTEGTPIFEDDWISLALSIYALYIGMDRYKIDPPSSVAFVLDIFPQLRALINLA